MGTITASSGVVEAIEGHRTSLESFRLVHIMIVCVVGLVQAVTWFWNRSVLTRKACVNAG